jgi:hypothetical protein
VKYQRNFSLSREGFLDFIRSVGVRALKRGFGTLLAVGIETQEIAKGLDGDDRAGDLGGKKDRRGRFLPTLFGFGARFLAQETRRRV